ncbi:MAG: OB-fold nucleic acid binding domain-containing protein, partial [Thermodesulfobacteriota bacterium]|nr:OB-fold nucleic acid binding domain-containing protein [Thermodesulfobacteriota bacterium]
MIKEQGHPWIKDINESDSIKGCYLIKGKKLGTTRKGDPFISITLADRTGEVEGKIWERAEEISSLFSQGDVVEVQGQAGSFQGRIQITISGIEAIQEEVDPGIFVESAGSGISEMMDSLREILRKIDNVHLKALVDKFLRDRQFVAIFKKAPAAKNFHHNYLGGLLEHTLSVCRMAANVASHYPQLDRDL